MGIYSVISVLYLWIDYMMPLNESSASDPDKPGKPGKPKTFAFIFLVGIWLTQFFITFNSLQQMCINSPNYGLAAWSSFATWIVLFVPLFWCLEYMYTWLRPFGNTFGYLIIKLDGLVSFMNSIVKTKAEGKIQEYLDYLKYDPWVMFSMLTTSEYAPDSVNASKKFDDLAKGYLKQDIRVLDAKNTFIKYVRAKESIAKFIFYVLTLNLMADITFVIAQENSPCVMNINEINEAASFKPPKLNPNATAKPAVVYKTSE